MPRVTIPPGLQKYAIQANVLACITMYRYAPHVNRVEVEEPLKYQKCTALQEVVIANTVFTQDNMFLGDVKHIQPLYLSGYITLQT